MELQQIKDIISIHKNDNDFLSKIKNYVEMCITNNKYNAHTEKLLDILGNPNENNIKVLNVYKNSKLNDLANDPNKDYEYGDELVKNTYIKIKYGDHIIEVKMNIWFDNMKDRMCQTFIVSVNKFEIIDIDNKEINDICNEINNHTFELSDNPNNPIQKDIFQKILFFCVNV